MSFYIVLGNMLIINQDNAHSRLENLFIMHEIVQIDIKSCIQRYMFYLHVEMSYSDVDWLINLGKANLGTKSISNAQ